MKKGKNMSQMKEVPTWAKAAALGSLILGLAALQQKFNENSGAAAQSQEKVVNCQVDITNGNDVQTTHIEISGKPEARDGLIKTIANTDGTIVSCSAPTDPNL